MIYVGVALGFFKQAGTAGARVLLVSIVDHSEVARSQGLISMMAYVSGMIRPLFDLIYNTTLEWHFGFVYCLASVLNLAAVVTFVAVHGLRRRQRKHVKKDTD